jgi:hypothetical protein
LALIIVALAFGGFAVKQGRDWLALRAEIAALRVRGEPLTFDELVTAYQADAQGTDLTDRWLECCAIIGNAVRKSEDNNPYTETFLNEQAETLSKLHELAVTDGSVRLPLVQDAETGFVRIALWDTREGDSPNALALFRRSPPDDLLATCRCLAAEARLHASRDDGAAAARSLCAGLALTRTLEHVPCTIGLLQRCGLRNQIYIVVKDLLPSGLFSAVDLATLQSTLSQESDLAADCFWGFRGERVGGIATFSIAWVKKDWLYRTWYYQSDKLAFLRAIQESSDNLQLPYPQAVAAGEYWTIDEDIKGHLVTELLIPAVGAMRMAFAGTWAAGRVVVLAVALTRYDRDHGKPPHQLADLVPNYLTELPTDPLFLAPFGYEVDPEGYTVFSPLKSYSFETRDPSTGFHKTMLYRSRFQSPDTSTPD